MNNEAIDITNTSRYLPQFDPSAPPTKLEALLHGDSEIAAEQFVAWLASEGQAERLYQIVISRLNAEDIQMAAAAWAKEVEHGYNA